METADVSWSRPFAQPSSIGLPIIGWSRHSSDSSERPAKVPRLASVIPRPVKQANPELVYWPKHLLPEALPSARILVYGYDTKVRHTLGTPISKNTVYDNASDLLGVLGG
ncbi:MAG: hypothetical protein Q9213_006509 [Squamulea squamosa]